MLKYTGIGFHSWLGGAGLQGLVYCDLQNIFLNVSLTTMAGISDHFASEGYCSGIFLPLKMPATVAAKCHEIYSLDQGCQTQFH